MLLLRFIRGLWTYGDSLPESGICPAPGPDRLWIILWPCRVMAGDPICSCSMDSPSDRRLPAVLLCFSHMAYELYSGLTSE